MDIRQWQSVLLVWWGQIWDFGFQPPCFFLRRSAGERMISTCVVPTVKHGGGGVIMWGCFAGDTVNDLLRIQGTLNQHSYHSILHPICSALSGTIICFSTGQWPNTPPGFVRAIWPRRREMECCVRWPGLHNHRTSIQIEMDWHELDRRVKQKQPTSAQHTSRLLEKYSRWNWLRECQECAKLSRQRVATLKNVKSKIYFNLFNTFLVATWVYSVYCCSTCGFRAFVWTLVGLNIILQKRATSWNVISHRERMWICCVFFS